MYVILNTMLTSARLLTSIHLTILDFRYWWHMHITGDYMHTVYRCAIKIFKWPEMDHIIHKYEKKKCILNAIFDQYKAKYTHANHCDQDSQQPLYVMPSPNLR